MLSQSQKDLGQANSPYQGHLSTGKNTAPPPAFQLKADGHSEHGHNHDHDGHGDDGHFHRMDPQDRQGVTKRPRTIPTGYSFRLISDRLFNLSAFQSILSGNEVLEIGSTGEAVRLVQQALVDLGLPVQVTGTYDEATSNAVIKVQELQGLTWMSKDGRLSVMTLKAIDTLYSDRSRVAKQFEGIDAEGLTAKTRDVTEEEAASFNDAIITENKGVNGQVPEFKREAPSGVYEDQALEILNDVIDQFHERYRETESRRNGEAGVHQWDEMENVADLAKQETDRMFGGLATGPAFRRGVNMTDAWEAESKKIEADKDYADRISVDLLNYFKRQHLGKLNKLHGAIPSREEEAGLLAQVSETILSSRKDELLDIQRNWPGLAWGNGTISIQMTKAADQNGRRAFMWEQFATIVHEYMHTLEHKDHKTYRNHLNPGRGGHTLAEGMCDYFTKMTWESMDFSPELRKNVEGLYHDPANELSIPTPFYYDSAFNAEQGVAHVGTANAMAAYFLGQLDKIGGALPEKSKGSGE